MIKVRYWYDIQVCCEVVCDGMVIGVILVVIVETVKSGNETLNKNGSDSYQTVTVNRAAATIRRWGRSSSTD